MLGWGGCSAALITLAAWFMLWKGNTFGGGGLGCTEGGGRSGAVEGPPNPEGPARGLGKEDDGPGRMGAEEGPGNEMLAIRGLGNPAAGGVATRPLADGPATIPLGPGDDNELEDGPAKEVAPSIVDGPGVGPELSTLDGTKPKKCI